MGVAPGASIYAYKVLGANGAGDYSGLIAALERATLVDHVNVVNMSLGGSEQSAALASAVTAAYATGAILGSGLGQCRSDQLPAAVVRLPRRVPGRLSGGLRDHVHGTERPADGLLVHRAAGGLRFAWRPDQLHRSDRFVRLLRSQRLPRRPVRDINGLAPLAGTVALVLAHGIHNGGDASTLADDVKAHLCGTASVGFGVNSTPIPTSDARYPKYFGCGVVDADNALITHPPTVDDPPPPPNNNPPAAVDDSATTQQDNAVTVSVLANDSDPTAIH